MVNVKLLWIVILVGLICPLVVSADKIARPRSYTKTTTNGEYLFVMISPLPIEKDKGHWIKERGAEIRKIRSTYTASGLYPNDSSITPLWSVEWYSYDVEPLSDGIHLVRPGPWASSPTSEAVAFFSNGVLIKSYSVSELVSFPWLMPHSVSHFTWRSSEQLLDESKQYEIRTKHWERYLFDVTTGQIVSEFRMPRLILVGCTVLFLLSGSFYIWHRRKRQVAEQSA